MPIDAAFWTRLRAARFAEAKAARHGQVAAGIAVADKVVLTRLLTAVGHIGSDIDRLAHISDADGKPDSHIIAEAQADIEWMRHHLMLALGVALPGIAPRS